MYHSGERFVKLVGLYLSLYPKYLGPWDFKAAHSLIPNTTLYSDWFNRETEQVPFLSLPRMSMCKPLPFLLCLHCLITLFLNVSGLPEEGWVLVKLTDFWSCVPKEERIWEWLGTSSPRDTLCEDRYQPHWCWRWWGGQEAAPALSTQVWPNGRLQSLSVSEEQYYSERGGSLPLFSEL